MRRSPLSSVTSVRHRPKVTPVLPEAEATGATVARAATAAAVPAANGQQTLTEGRARMGPGLPRASGHIHVHMSTSM